MKVISFRAFDKMGISTYFTRDERIEWNDFVGLGGIEIRAAIVGAMSLDHRIVAVALYTDPSEQLRGLSDRLNLIMPYRTEFRKFQASFLNYKGGLFIVNGDAFLDAVGSGKIRHEDPPLYKRGG